MTGIRFHGPAIPSYRRLGASALQPRPNISRLRRVASSTFWAKPLPGFPAFKLSSFQAFRLCCSARVTACEHDWPSSHHWRRCRSSSRPSLFPRRGPARPPGSSQVRRLVGVTAVHPRAWRCPCRAHRGAPLLASIPAIRVPGTSSRRGRAGSRITPSLRMVPVVGSPRIDQNFYTMRSVPGRHSVGTARTACV